jgi:hypothetical protein
MAKLGAYKKRKRQNFDPVVKIVAEKHGLSARQIRNIRDGKRRNDIVLSDYSVLKEWFELGEKKADWSFLEKVKALLDDDQNYPLENPSFD